MEKPIQIVVTQGSGDGLALSQAKAVKHALAEAGHPARVRAFGRLGELRQWAKTCGDIGSHLIVVGGDATLSEAAVAAMRLGVPLVPVPSGFGNLFARTLGYRPEPASVVELLRRGRLARVDAGAAPGGIFLSHQSYGALAHIQEATERQWRPRQRLLRYLAYLQAAVRWLREAAPGALRIDVDGQALAREAGLVTVANVETYRGFLNLTPGASPLDGLLDICAIPRTSPARLLARLLGLLAGIPGARSGVDLRRGRRVRIQREDGGIEEVRVLKGAVPALVPPGVAVAEPATPAKPPRRAALGGVLSARPAWERPARWRGSRGARPHPARSRPPVGSAARS
jgi:diacylglycerol kinase family enzyme